MILELFVIIFIAIHFIEAVILNFYLIYKFWDKQCVKGEKDE